MPLPVKLTDPAPPFEPAEPPLLAVLVDTPLTVVLPSPDDQPEPPPPPPEEVSFF